jgi:DNA-binding response OmpR family regulator
VKSPSVLMVEDDERLARMVKAFMSTHGFAVDIAADAAAARAAMRTREFDLIVLDLMLPDADGLDICRELRASDARTRDVPIIMVTARGDLTDRIIGLEIGADDYLPKPFEARELLARARAVLRRTVVGRTRPASEVLRFGALEIDRGSREIRVGQELRTLTSFQFDLLVVLARSAGRVLSRDQLRQATRGEASEAFDRSIDVQIGKIRAAIEKDPQLPKRIITVRNVGYVFSRAQDGA